MKIDDLNSTGSALPPIVHEPKRQSDPSPRQFADKSGLNITSRKSSEGTNALSSDRILYNKIESANDQSLAVARKIRAVDKTMAQVEEKVNDMHTFLEGVVKAYPPYPPGSSERVEAMRKFAALRKQIDQLMYPPPDDEVSTLPVNGGGKSEGGPWRLSGDMDLKLPELAADAGDSELNDALDSLGKAYEALQRQHKAFIEDANHIIATLK